MGGIVPEVDLKQMEFILSILITFGKINAKCHVANSYIIFPLLKLMLLLSGFLHSMLTDGHKTLCDVSLTIALVPGSLKIMFY